MTPLNNYCPLVAALVTNVRDTWARGKRGFGISKCGHWPWTQSQTVIFPAAGWQVHNPMKKGVARFSTFDLVHG